MKITKVATSVVFLHVIIAGIMLLPTGCIEQDRSATPIPANTIIGSTDSKTSTDPENDVFMPSAQVETLQSSKNNRSIPRRPESNIMDTAPLYEAKAILEPISHSKENAFNTQVDLEFPKNDIYIVKKGDSLWQIAKEHNITLHSLLSANDLNPSSIIHPNMEIIISKEGENIIQQHEIKPATLLESPEFYEVKRGDTLSKIALMFGYTIKEIKEFNGLNNDKIFEGQKLKIAGAETHTHIHPIASKENFDSNLYIVKPGDTLSDIAKKTGSSVSDLMELNNITDPSKLQIGTKLSIDKDKSEQLSPVSLNIVSLPNEESGNKNVEIKDSSLLYDEITNDDYNLQDEEIDDLFDLEEEVPIVSIEEE